MEPRFIKTEETTFLYKHSIKIGKKNCGSCLRRKVISNTRRQWNFANSPLFEQFKSSGNDYEKVKFEQPIQKQNFHFHFHFATWSCEIFNEELMVFVIVEDISPLPRSKRMKLHHRFNCGKNRVKGTVWAGWNRKYSSSTFWR